MKFSIKTYKLIKIKNYLKESAMLLFYNTITPKNSIRIMQELKRLDLNHYKLSNTMAKQILNSSIYQNYSSLISSFVMLIFPKKTINLNKLKYFNSTVTFLGIKMNNKIYTFKNIFLETKYEFNKDYFNLAMLSKFSLKTLLQLKIN